MTSVGDRAKLEFLEKALKADDPLQGKPKLCKDVADALAWRNARSAQDAIKERERVSPPFARGLPLS